MVGEHVMQMKVDDIAHAHEKPVTIVRCDGRVQSCGKVGS